MADTVIGGFTGSFSYTHTGYSGSGGTVVDSLPFSFALTFDTTSITKAYSYVADGGNHNALLPAASPLTLTLSALAGAQGTLAFASVRFFFFANQSTTDSVVVKPGATHGWTNGLPAAKTVPPGGVLIFGGPADPSYAVSSGSNDQITIDATGASAPVAFTLGVLGN